MDFSRRLRALERLTGSTDGGCRACETLRHRPVFLREDGQLCPGSWPLVCPSCGREPGPRKVYVGINLHLL